jgi:hypothetical protein
MPLYLPAGFRGLHLRDRTLGSRASMFRSIFSSIFNRLLPLGMLAAKSEIDHLAHVMTRALAACYPQGTNCKNAIRPAMALPR